MKQTIMRSSKHKVKKRLRNIMSQVASWAHNDFCLYSELVVTIGIHAAPTNSKDAWSEDCEDG